MAEKETLVFPFFMEISIWGLARKRKASPPSLRHRELDAGRYVGLAGFLPTAG